MPGRYNASSIEGGIFGVHSEDIASTERPLTARSAAAVRDSVGATLFNADNAFAQTQAPKMRLKPEDCSAAGVVKRKELEPTATPRLDPNASSVEGGIFYGEGSSMASAKAPPTARDSNASSIKGGIFGYASSDTPNENAPPSIPVGYGSATARDRNASSIPGGIFG